MVVLSSISLLYRQNLPTPISLSLSPALFRHLTKNPLYRSEKGFLMGCFFGCFGTHKHRKSQQSSNIINPGDQKHEVLEDFLPTQSFKQENTENPINITELKEKNEEKLSCNRKKKVTFDLNVTTYEDLSTQEVIDDLRESNLEKESEKNEETQEEGEFLSDSIGSSTASSPLNHRCQNCTNSDSEYEDSGLEESDLDNDSGGDDEILVQEESSESLFSLSIDSRKQLSAIETGDDKEVNSPMPVHTSHDQELRAIGSNQIARNRSQFVLSVLNPVENLTQWKAAKEKATVPLKYDSKENIKLEEFNIPFSPKPSLNLLKHHHSKENTNLDEEFNVPFSPKPSLKLLMKRNSNPPKGLDQEIAVDASVSSWLIEFKTTPNTKTGTVSVGNSTSERENSSRSIEDRTILGVLTMEERKQFSAHSSPRRSPKRRPDDTPILGTVGSYWSHTGQSIDDSDSGSSCQNLSKATSKCREDKGMNLLSSPFEARFERA